MSPRKRGESTDSVRDDLMVKVAKNLSKKAFDNAVLDAVAFLEVRLQEVGNTKTINTTLVKEVFDNGRLRISDDPDRNIGAKNLFDGAFRLIRNDRGHNKTTSLQVEVPCKTKAECHRILGYVSYLLDLLDRNLVFKPKIDFIQTGSQLRLRGQYFSRDISVQINHKKVGILSLEPNEIILELPSVTKGLIEVEHPNFGAISVEYELPKERSACTRVEAAGFDVYSDKECTRKITGVKGVLLLVLEKGRQYLRAAPTKKRYKAGDYIEDKYEGGGVGESWYKDPTDGNRIKYGWTGSALMAGKPVGHAGLERTTSLIIKPEKIAAAPGERRLLRALAIKTDGVRHWEEDVSGYCVWESSDDTIAHVDNNGGGYTYLKKLGSTSIRCSFEKFYAESSVEVLTPTRGFCTTFFAGDIHHYQTIRFDDRGSLYVANQEDCVLKISDRVESVLRLPKYIDPKYGEGPSQPVIDCIGVDRKGNIYANSLRPNVVYRLDDKRLSPVLSSSTPLKKIDIDSIGNIYIAGWENGIFKVAPDGTKSVFKTIGSTISLRLVDDNRIIVGSAGGGALLRVHSTADGKLIRSFKVPGVNTPTDFAVHEGVVYVADFRGAICKLDLEGDGHEMVTTLQTIGGIDFDKAGDLYVAIFDSSNQADISIKKIYLA